MDINFFQYDFINRAIIAVTILSICFPLIGVFIILRKYSLIADSLSHVSLGGIVIGKLLGIDPILSALAISTASGIVIEKIRSSKKLYGDSILAMFLSGGLGVAVFLISTNRDQNFNLTSLLFGSILTITNTDLLIISVLSGFTFITLLLIYRKLFSISFDEEFEAASGVNVQLYNYIFIALSSMVVGFSISIVGALLVGGIMVIPVNAALQFKYNFRNTVILSAIFALFSSISGVIISFYLNTPTGASIILVAIFLFTLSYFVNKSKKL